MKMNIKKVLKEQIELIQPEKEIVKQAKKYSKEFISELGKEIAKKSLNADVFVGGSFAKGTLVKKYPYDIDILVRFDWKYDNLSKLLLSPLRETCKKLNLQLKTIRGSRDYFKAYINKGIYFEVIPVTKIKKVHEERNVTDLSYFHVPYVKRKIKGKEDEVRLAKTFLHAQRVYGAESYIQGFSGYALECLIIHYKSFEKMLKELIKVKDEERLVIDVEKHYKKKDDVFLELNENKLYSPIILIDPTYKERNALAALSHKTFVRFQRSASAFLKRPSKNFFIKKEIDVGKLKKKAKTRKAEFLHVKLKTNRQAGDIAGTKLKKFHYLLEREINKYFKLVQHEFEYDDKKEADVYLIVKSRGEIVRIGPPIKLEDKQKMRALEKHVKAFKLAHKNTYEKNGFVHARIKVNFSGKEFIENWKKENDKMMNEMGIVGLRVLE
ncbi:MAG: nucleotidyltransferase domain-containing protein [Nanoarchaeota archaeon]|nr:nucleotidyltransferase domain-containing protein [Nanoarchaeota archaeon]